MIRDYIKDKALGFWFTAGIAVLSLATAITYAASYAGTENINWFSFAFMLAAFVAAVVLVAIGRFGLTPYIQAALVFLSLLFFIYGIYYYVSVVLVGIDLDSFDPEFIVCTVLYAATFGLSVANVFLKQIKGEVRENA
ncbi:MAG: hypothetical protein HFK09_02095 [Clostridia bacterium]|nr:hypothetical protein [Clostridia bacterium]